MTWFATLVGPSERNWSEYPVSSDFVLLPLPEHFFSARHQIGWQNFFWRRHSGCVRRVLQTRCWSLAILKTSISLDNLFRYEHNVYFSLLILLCILEICIIYIYLYTSISWSSKKNANLPWTKGRLLSVSQKPPTSLAAIAGDLRQSGGGRHFSNGILSVKSFDASPINACFYFCDENYGNFCVEDFQGPFFGKADGKLQKFGAKESRNLGY